MSLCRARARRVARVIPHGGRSALLRGIGIGFWLVFAVAATGLGQGPARSPSRFYPDSSETVESLLRNAAGQVRNQQWAEAIEIYQRVIERFGDKVTRLPREAGADPGGDFALYVDGRSLCHREIAALPAEARALYRARMDGEAEHWYRQGEAGDLAALRRVVEQAFCSAWGDEAIERLGDLAFHDGRMGLALAMYRQLVADPGSDPLVLVHPDPSVDLARVAAKKLLCRAIAGEHPPTASDLAAYAKAYPDAGGELAGRKGLYREIVAQALGQDRLGAEHELDLRWPTFAGSQRRTKIVPGPVDIGSVQWRVELSRPQTGRGPGGFVGARGFGGPTGFGPTGARLLAYHPIVLGDQVIVADGVRVLAYNLSDRPIEGDTAATRVEPAWKHDPEDGQTPRAVQIHGGIPRYTLTAYGRRVFARMGGVGGPYFPGMGVPPGRGESSILALDWNAQGKLLWERKASSLVLPNRPAARAAFGRTVSFEGTPVADADSVYVAVVDRREQTATYVACLDAELGATRWVRYVGTASTDGDFIGGPGLPMPTAGHDSGHRLLSLDGPTIYYQTNLGAVVAIDTDTGSIRWAAAYPRSETGRSSSGDRDLNPAVVDQGRVFVAPADSDAIYAFSADTGRLLWKTEAIPEDVRLSHLLGVAKGRLVATGDRVLLFDAATGKLLHAWPDAGKSLEGYGRGLLAGDYIYWPTKDEIQILDQRSGVRAEQPIKLHETYHTGGGNLAAGDGYLIVSQADGIVVFCQNSRLIERYRQQIAHAPDRASSYYRLARAAESLGRDHEALVAYREASKRAGASETIDGVVLSQASRDRQYRLLLRLGDDARKAKRFDESAGNLQQAALAAVTDQDRLRAQIALADVLLDAGRPRDAVDVCQRILADDGLRGLPTAADGRRHVRADLLVADRLGLIVRKHGRNVYAAYDREAERLYERGRSERDARVLASVARMYPVASVVADSLFALAAVEEQAGRAAEAASAYKRLLLFLGDDPRRPRALFDLARVYESRKLHGAARQCYLEIKDRLHEAVQRSGDSRSLYELASRALASPPYDRLDDPRSAPNIPLPLERRFELALPRDPIAHVLTAQGVAPAPELGRVFVVEPAGLRLVDPRKGALGWSVKIGARASWAAFHGDRLIVGAADRIAAFDFGQSTERWRYEPAEKANARNRPDPFAEQDDEHPADAAPMLSGYWLEDGHVFCLRGHEELVALDAETGAVEWSFRGSQAIINPALWIGPERIVLQIDRPNQLLVLRTDDGMPLARAALDENERLERPPLPLDDGSVVVVPDRMTVKRFDLESGQFTWAYQESDQLPVNGPPAVFGDGERLFVIHEGRTLIRLNPATGSKRYSVPLGFEDLSNRPDAVAFDAERFYCVSKKTLRAIAIEDGKPLWSRAVIGPLDATWSILAAERHLIVYPRSVIAADPDEVESMPVSVRDKRTGAIVERFAFATAIAQVRVDADSRGLIASSRTGLWSLGPRRAARAQTHEIHRPDRAEREEQR